jgi:peptide/nickel transport system substrate-binding protein
VKIELEAVEFRQLLGRQRAGDFELSGAARSLAPNWEPRQNYHTEGDNRAGFGNAETDALMGKIQETLDDDERYKLYKELQAIIYDERPEIYIMTYSVRFAIHKRFETPISAYFPGYFPNYMKLRSSEMTAGN